MIDQYDYVGSPKFKKKKKILTQYLKEKGVLDDDKDETKKMILDMNMFITLLIIYIAIGFTLLFFNPVKKVLMINLVLKLQFLR